MAELELRLKCRAGTFPMTVPTSLAVSDLREQASALSQIPVASIKLLLGFPPKPIPRTDGSVGEAGLKSGDTIIAEADPNSGAAAASVAPSRAVEAETAAATRPETEVLRHVTGGEITVGDVPLILRKIVPADNSCLFTSLGFVLGGSTSTRQIRIPVGVPVPRENALAILL